MPEPFDPYRELLGIENSHRPLTHYELLGLEDFSRSNHLILRRADERIEQVTAFLGGPHARAAQRTLFELKSAKQCLLEPTKKATYDAALKAQSCAIASEDLGLEVDEIPVLPGRRNSIEARGQDSMFDSLPAPAFDQQAAINVIRLRPTAERKSKDHFGRPRFCLVVLPRSFWSLASAFGGGHRRANLKYLHR